MRNLIGGTFLMIVCAVVGAYLAAVGAAAAGLRSSQWSLEPLVYLALGFTTGVISFLCIAYILSFKTRMTSGNLMFVAAVSALILAFLSGLVGDLVSKHNLEINLKKSAAQSRASDQRYEHFYSMLRKDPGLSLKESWYQATDERRYAYRMSIQDRDVDYSPLMISQLYVLDDQMSVQLLAHHSFDPLLLESEFHKALKRAIRGGSECDKLQAILKNPNAKDSWFAEVASSGIVEKDIFLYSDDSSRQKVSSSLLASGTNSGQRAAVGSNMRVFLRSPVR